jgi:hypothetical protein
MFPDRAAELGFREPPVPVRLGERLTTRTQGKVPTQLEQIWRGHWTIENRVHDVRDETLGEDRCQLWSGTAPQALAAFRNAVLSLLSFHGWSNITAATRNYASHPQHAYGFLACPHHEIALTCTWYEGEGADRTVPDNLRGARRTGTAVCTAANRRGGALQEESSKPSSKPFEMRCATRASLA